MGKPYSDDLRRGVVQAIETGHTYEETADLCGVSISSVSRFLTRWRRTGNVSPQKFGGYKGYALAPYRRQIERWVDAQPDLTLAELQARLAERDVVVSQTVSLDMVSNGRIRNCSRFLSQENRWRPSHILIAKSWH